MRYSFISFAQLFYPFEFLLGTRTCCFILSPFQYFKELICLVLPPRFWGESGCKDKHFIPSYPNIFASFFKLFFQNCRFYQVRIMSGMFYKLILTLSRVESGCKFTRFLWTSKSLLEFFWKFMLFRICTSEKELFWTILNTEYQYINRLHLHHCFNPLFLIAGAKINQLYHLFQIFLRIFWDYFQSILTASFRSDT